MSNENLKMSKQGLDLLKNFEKCRLVAYDDNGKSAGGVWTIGWGCTRYANGVAVKEGDKITQADADNELVLAMPSREKGVKLRISKQLKQYEFDALVDFMYNTGGGYMDKNKLRHDYDLFHNINEGMTAPGLKEYWEHCAITQAGVPLLGLRRRRAAQYHLFANGVNHPDFFASLK